MNTKCYKCDKCKCKCDIYWNWYKRSVYVVCIKNVEICRECFEEYSRSEYSKLRKILRDNGSYELADKVLDMWVRNDPV
jgi:hypothetical protein